MKHSCDTTIQGDSVVRFEQKGFYACENGDGYHCVKIDREKNIVSFLPDSDIRGYTFDCILKSNDETEYICTESEGNLTLEQLTNAIRANNLF